jgi:hypothetical protein
MINTGVATQNVAGIVQNIIASAIWLIIGLAVARSYFYLRRGRHFRKVWALSRSSKSVQIIAASLQPQPTLSYARPATGLGELIALSHISESLTLAYRGIERKTSISLSSGFPSNHLDQTLICLGGPRHNDVTRLLTRYCNPRYSYQLTNGTAVIDSKTDMRYMPDMKSAELRRDYALIYRMPNPFNPKCAAFILSGAHTYGVSAAGKIFNAEHIRELSKAVARLGPAWEVLMQVDCVGDVEFPHIVTASTLTPSTALKERVGD